MSPIWEHIFIVSSPGACACGRHPFGKYAVRLQILPDKVTHPHLSAIACRVGCTPLPLNHVYTEVSSSRSEWALLADKRLISASARQKRPALVKEFVYACDSTPLLSLVTVRLPGPKTLKATQMKTIMNSLRTSLLCSRKLPLMLLLFPLRSRASRLSS
jgi:hypothetical protein